jgi:hypothetical protein
MTRNEILILFALALIVLVAESALVHVPGYMDADYYYAGGMQLANGKGFTEPFLWNYLDNPVGIPHPAYTYWMPLTAILAGIGMAITGKPDFISARLLIILLAAIVPPFTAYVSWQLSHRKLSAWLAGGLAIFPGFYGIYMGITDTFPLYMLLGTLFLILASASYHSKVLKYIGLGLVAGLMHLARADGILWLAFGILLILFEGLPNLKQVKQFIPNFLFPFLSLSFSYILIMGLWYLRNYSLFGTLLSPAGGRVLWITNYDQMFGFPSTQFNYQSWLANGLGPALSVRWDALGANLQNALAVQAEVLLLPFILVGCWRLRNVKVIRMAGLMYAATFLVMTLVFPLAGGRGGFFHSGSAFQLILWAAAAEGFIGIVELGVRFRKNWKFERASKGFAFLLFFLTAVLTLALLMQQVIGEASSPSVWDKSFVDYKAVEKSLVDLGAGQDQIVAVNNPPGYYVATGRQAIVIPDGSVNSLLAAAKQFNASYLILERNTVSGLRDLYNRPRSMQGLVYLKSVDQIQIFKFVKP